MLTANQVFFCKDNPSQKARQGHSNDPTPDPVTNVNTATAAAKLIIIVEFYNFWVRRQVYAAKRQLKHTGIFSSDVALCASLWHAVLVVWWCVSHDVALCASLWHAVLVVWWCVSHDVAVCASLWHAVLVVWWYVSQDVALCLHTTTDECTLFQMQTTQEKQQNQGMMDLWIETLCQNKPGAKYQNLHWSRFDPI